MLRKEIVLIRIIWFGARFFINRCSRLGLSPLAYLWQRNQKELLKEMIDCKIDAIIIKVATMGMLCK